MLAFMMEIKFFASLRKKKLERKFLKEIVLLIKKDDWMEVQYDDI